MRGYCIGLTVTSPPDRGAADSDCLPVHQLRRLRFHAGSWMAFGILSQCVKNIRHTKSSSHSSDRSRNAAQLLCCGVISRRASTLGRMRGAGGVMPHLHTAQYAQAVSTGPPQCLQEIDMQAHLHFSEQ